MARCETWTARHATALVFGCWIAFTLSLIGLLVCETTSTLAVIHEYEPVLECVAVVTAGCAGAVRMIDKRRERRAAPAEVGQLPGGHV